MHALLIEDDLLIATVLAEELRNLGYDSVDSVETQTGAVDAACTRAPDLIVADDQITEGSGVDAVKTICATKIIPVIYVLGDPNRRSDLLAYACSTPKPFTMSELAASIQTAISRADEHRRAQPFVQS